MQIAHNRRLLSITRSRPRQLFSLAAMLLLAAGLIFFSFDGAFYKTSSFSPAYTQETKKLSAGKSFLLEQRFTPARTGMTQLVLSYYNARKTETPENVTVCLISPDGTQLMCQTAALSTQKGDLKLRISLADVQLQPGTAYTLRLAPGDEHFTANLHSFLIQPAQDEALPPAGLNSAPLSGGESLVLQWSYRYFDVWGCVAAAGLILLIGFLCLFNFHFGAKASAIYNILCAVCTPVLLFAIVEWLNFGGLGQISFPHILLNLCWYIILYLFFFLLCNRLALTLLLGSAFFYIFGIANHLVLLFRGSTILPADLIAAPTAFKVLQKYTLKPTAALLLSFLCFTVLLLSVARANFRLPGRKARLIGIAVILPLCIGFPLLYCNAGFLESAALTPYHWQQTAACRQRGFIANFTSNIPSMMVEKPKGYDPASLDVVIDGQRVPSMAAQAGQPRRPHIIVVMNESFSDLSAYGDLHTDCDPLAFFHSLSGDNVIKGQVAVPVFGGTTCNSEFEFLTGNSTAFLPFGSVPFQQFIKEDTPSLVSYLGGLGYQKLAFHPYSPYGWSRNTVYPALGFTQFYSQSSVPDAKKLRWYISDESNYNKLITLFEENKQKEPLFLFNVTMQNHGGYDYAPFSDTVRLKGYQQAYPQAQQYLTLLKASDDALQELISSLQAQDDPVILCFFGDHLPNLETEFYEELFGGALAGKSVNEIPAAHRTPFLIWANFPLADATENYGTIGVNYLSALLVRAAGLPTSPYQNFLLALQDMLPVVSTTGIFDAQGREVDPEDENSPYYPLLLTYRQLQYNALFDQENRSDALFSAEK